MRRVGFDQALLRVHAAVRNPTLWPEALTDLADHLGAIGGMLTRHGHEPGTAFVVTGRLDPALASLYLRDGCARRTPWAPQAGPMLDHALWPTAAPRHGAVQDEGLAPQRIGDLAMLNYAPWGGGKGGGGFAFRLDRRAADASAGLLRRLARLAPHLRQALDLAGTLQAARITGSASAAVLDTAPRAVLLLDTAGRLRHANPAGEALLREADGLRLVPAPAGPGRLGTALASEGCQLRRLIATAVAAGLGGRMRISRARGNPAWPVLVTPLPGAEEHLFGDAHASVAVLVGGAATPPAPDVLQAAFGLTIAEARVLRRIAGGAGVPDTAAALSLSPETVRSQLARCFDATGCRSQAALAALVAGLP
ncbi:helix-turn-helix transcriptional regulator [Belnapia rosea]|uniref:DNA-binding transcriptional regulator, CsgD family n=2 Tax=Belnapia rosea TaxID=938405 RepID=A0A1G6KJR7_9PROT|nr:helix-turn-helix transcriptional regulator [Belnapia rosea]SDB19090.1 DNA-binding transcriptional regulator, CsgD family [Belnapia rosea]SDC31213.1 DNA-binding transcriptional regulator, CsgD family [Belnapia rosea]